MYQPNKFFLLRGGRVVKIEAQSMGNMRYIYWAETQHFRPLTQDRLRFDDRDNADFLNEEGQLRYNLSVEAEELRIWGVNLNVNSYLFRMSNFTSRNTVRSITLSSLRQYARDTTSTQLTSLSTLLIMSDIVKPTMINDYKIYLFHLGLPLKLLYEPLRIPSLLPSSSQTSMYLYF